MKIVLPTSNGGFCYIIKKKGAVKLKIIMNDNPVPIPDGLVLHRTLSNVDVGLIIAGAILFFPTFSFATWPIVLYFILHEIFRKTYLVKNEKTGEKLIVRRDEYNVYRKQFKQQQKDKSKVVHSISDLESAEDKAKAVTLPKIDDFTVDEVNAKDITADTPDFSGPRHEDNKESDTAEEATIAEEPTAPADTPVIDEKKSERKAIKTSSFSVTFDEGKFYAEYIDFHVAGVSFRQPAIRKAVKIEKENGYFDEPYEGMTTKEIKEDSYGEKIYQYDDIYFSNCGLKLDLNNKYDKKAIAVYANDQLVGYVPKKKFKEAKDYLYDQIKAGSELIVDLVANGGKYKLSDDGETIETGTDDYYIEAHVTIKTPKN